MEQIRQEREMDNQEGSAIAAYTAAMPIMAIQQAVERQRQMTAFVQQIMKDGTDYGTIPGTNKPTLLKPGAEKLTTFFGLTVKFDTVKAEEKWGDDGTEPFFYYWYRCRLYRGDLLIAEGDGSCNSRESKYRWRWVGEEDISSGMDKALLKTRGGTTSEFDFAVEKAETTGRYGKPVEYWQRFKDGIVDGTARKFKKRTRAGKEYDAWEIDATVYRVPNDDIASQVNTINKMAQKRALIAATLIAVNASEFFTQDLEDFESHVIAGNGSPTTRIEPKKERGGNGKGNSPPAPHSDYDPIPDIEALELGDEFNEAAISNLDYDHARHVVNTLDQELGMGWGQRFTRTHLWKTLEAHQAAKVADDNS